MARGGLACWGFLFGFRLHNFAYGEPTIDKPAPSLVAKSTLDGQVFDLSKLRGDVVLVNYWGDMVRALPQGHAVTRHVLSPASPA